MKTFGTNSHEALVALVAILFEYHVLKLNIDVVNKSLKCDFMHYDFKVLLENNPSIKECEYLDYSFEL